VLAELAARPEEAAHHEVQVTRVAHRGVAVTERRAEDTRVPVIVDPGNHVVYDLFSAVLLFDPLPAARERIRCRENPEVVVKLFFDGGPVRQTARDGVFAVGEGDGNG